MEDQKVSGAARDGISNLPASLSCPFSCPFGNLRPSSELDIANKKAGCANSIAIVALENFIPI